MNTENENMPHGQAAGMPIQSYASLVVKACDECREVISLSSKLRRQFPKLEGLERRLLAEGLEHMGRCAYELAAQLREEGK